jgi:hypothetical protein
VLWFVPAALIPLGGFFYTTYLASGDLRPFYAFFGTNVYEYVHQGIPSYWKQPQGIDAGIDSPLTYFLNCLIGHHGVLSLSPASPGRSCRPWSGAGWTLWARSNKRGAARRRLAVVSAGR